MGAGRCHGFRVFRGPAPRSVIIYQVSACAPGTVLGALFWVLWLVRFMPYRLQDDSAQADLPIKKAPGF